MIACPVVLVNRGSAALTLNLPPNIVDTVGRTLTKTCARCGGPVVVKNSGRPPKFCSDTCRRGHDASRKRQFRLESRNQKSTLKVDIPDVGYFALRYAEQTFPMDGFWESECYLLALAGELYDMPVKERTDFACRAIEARLNPRSGIYLDV